MTAEDCYALVAEWRQIARDNAMAAEQFTHLADQLQAALEAGKATFEPPPKKPKLWPGAKAD
jgi:hypothetical protein